jgi:hypothetical protein
MPGSCALVRSCCTAASSSHKRADAIRKNLQKIAHGKAIPNSTKRTGRWSTRRQQKCWSDERALAMEMAALMAQRERLLRHA